MLRVRGLGGLAVVWMSSGCGLLLDAELPVPTEDARVQDLGGDDIASDRSDALDALATVSDATRDAADDAPQDASDALDRSDVSDASDAFDASDASDAFDASDGGDAEDVTDVPMECLGRIRALSPLSGAIVASNRPLLEWVDRCTAGYVVTVARDRGLRDVVDRYRDVAVTEARMQLEGLAPGVYFWQVRRRIGPAPSEPTGEFRVLREALSDPSLSRSTLGLMPDINGDGTSDLVVGVPAGVGGVGEVAWSLGGLPDEPSTRGRIRGSEVFPLMSEATLAQTFGARVSPLGDVNGDGRPDMLAATLGPVAVVLFGSAEALSAGSFRRVAIDAPALSLDGSFPAVAGIGDFDRDGLGDIAVGASSFHISVVTFNPDRLGYAFMAPTPGLAFGRAIAPAWDTNADGCTDVIVGAPLAMAGVSSQRFLLTGSVAGARSMVSAVPAGTPAPTAVGASWVASAGDQNADGRADWLWSQNQQVVFEGNPPVFTPMGFFNTASPTGIFLAAAVGDHDHNRVFETFAFINGSTGGLVQRLTNNGSGVAMTPVPGLSDDVRQVGTAGDLDGDNDDEPLVLTVGPTGTNLHVYGYTGDALTHRSARPVALATTRANVATAY